MTKTKLSERITPGKWQWEKVPEVREAGRLSIAEWTLKGPDVLCRFWYDKLPSADAQLIALAPDLLRVSEAMAEALRKALDQIPDYRDEDWPAPAHEGFCHPDAGCDATCSEIAAMSETMQVRRLLIQWLAEWEKLGGTK